MTILLIEMRERFLGSRDRKIRLSSGLFSGIQSERLKYIFPLRTAQCAHCAVSNQTGKNTSLSGPLRL